MRRIPCRKVKKTSHPMLPFYTTCNTCPQPTTQLNHLNSPFPAISYNPLRLSHSLKMRQRRQGIGKREPGKGIDTAKQARSAQEGMRSRMIKKTCRVCVLVFVPSSTEPGFFCLPMMEKRLAKAMPRCSPNRKTDGAAGFAQSDGVPKWLACIYTHAHQTANPGHGQLAGDSSCHGSGYMYVGGPHD